MEVMRDRDEFMAKHRGFSYLYFSLRQSLMRMHGVVVSILNVSAFFFSRTRRERMTVASGL